MMNAYFDDLYGTEIDEKQEEVGMKENDISRCKHCIQEIRWTRKFGWIHGQLSGGWNPSCEDDANLAEPVVFGESATEDVKHIIGEAWPIRDESGSVVGEVSVNASDEEDTMSDTEKHVVSEEAKNKLADLFMLWSRKDEAWEGVYNDHESAVEIVDRIIEAGWSPDNA